MTFFKNKRNTSENALQLAFNNLDYSDSSEYFPED